MKDRTNTEMMPILQSVLRWTWIYFHTIAKYTQFYRYLVTLVDINQDFHLCLDFWSPSSIITTTVTIWFTISSLKITGKVLKPISKHRIFKICHNMEMKNAFLQEIWILSSNISILWLEIGVNSGLIHRTVVVVEELVNIKCSSMEEKFFIMKPILWDFYIN